MIETYIHDSGELGLKQTGQMDCNHFIQWLDNPENIEFKRDLFDVTSNMYTVFMNYDRAEGLMVVRICDSLTGEICDRESYKSCVALFKRWEDNANV